MGEWCSRNVHLQRRRRKKKKYNVQGATAEVKDQHMAGTAVQHILQPVGAMAYNSFRLQYCSVAGDRR
jgi:hypothetical protein